MDQGLKAQIHRYAEDREIDYMSAKNLGVSYGVEFYKDQDLVEFKQLIDTYLKTFKEEALDAVEEVCLGKKKDKKNKKVVKESNIVCPACGKHIDSPGKQCPLCKNVKSKAVKESVNEIESYASEAGNTNLKDNKINKSKKTKKTKKKSKNEAVSLADMLSID